jgi:hypothetical protein
MLSFQIAAEHFDFHHHEVIPLYFTSRQGKFHWALGRFL